jgi:hypothetical protein
MEQSQDKAAIAQHQSLEQKMFSLIAEQQSSNMKIGPFCDRHQIVRSRYYYWLRKYRNRQSDENKATGFELIRPEPEYSSSLFCELVTPEGIHLRFFRSITVSFLKSLL